MTHQLGYGRWEELKYEIRKAWNFRFDWFIKVGPVAADAAAMCS
jgi:hypothetical protein